MSRKTDRQEAITMVKDGLNDVERLMLRYVTENGGSVQFDRCTEAEQPEQLALTLIAGIAKPRGLERTFWEASVRKHATLFIDNGVFQLKRCGQARISNDRLRAIVYEARSREVRTTVPSGASYVNRPRAARGGFAFA